MSEYPKTTGKEKLIYVEVIRIIAIFFVIFNHTNQRGYVLFTLYDIGSPQYYIYMIFAVIAGINVPLFYMISGMFLLNKQDESIGYVLKRRIPKYIVVLIGFSLFHYFRHKHWQIGAFSLKEFLKIRYSSGVIIPYWFIYSYLAFLMILPFLRKIAAGFDKKAFLYLVGLQLLFCGIIPMLQYRFSAGTLYLNNSLTPVFISNSIIFYPLIGYYLGNKLKKVEASTLAILALLFVVSVASSIYMTDYKIRLTEDIGEGTVSTFFGTTRVIQVIFVFLFVRKIFEHIKLPKIAGKLITSLGSCVFGIYLIEEALRESLYFIYDKIKVSMNRLLAITLYILMIMFLGWLIIGILKTLLNLILDLFRKRTRSVRSQDQIIDSK